MINNPVKSQIGDTLAFIKSQMSYTTIRYDTFSNIAKKYFKVNDFTTNPELKSLQKAYSRWDHFWQDRINVLDNTGLHTDRDYVYKLNKDLADGILNLCTPSPHNNAWSCLGPFEMITPDMGIVTAVAQQPNNSNIIYCGTKASGLWKTIDGGQNWVNITDNLSVSALGISTIAIDITNPNIIYVGTGAQQFNYESYGVGIIKSLDAGSTWTILDLPTNSNNAQRSYKVEVIKINPIDNNKIYAVGDNYFYKSINSGVSWTYTAIIDETIKDNDIRDLEININNTNILYASTDNQADGGSGNLFVSINDGATWTNISPNNVLGRVVVDVTPADPNYVYSI